MQVSEDHCWIHLGSDGQRKGSVEVTTDTAAKRGLAAGEKEWSGWLYTGGHGVLCSPQVTWCKQATISRLKLN